jgi:hypothetical protein
VKSYTLTTAPAIEPVTLAEALTFMRAASGLEDALVSTLISAAREYVENLTQRALITQTWTLTMPDWYDRNSVFPAVYASWYGALANGVTNAGAWYGNYDVTAQNGDATALTLDRSPLISVSSVKYYPASGGAQVTLTQGTDYAVSTVATPGRITPAVNASWPALAARPDAVQIVFVAGYGAAETAVPAMLRLAVLALTNHFYDQRAIITETRSVEAIPHTLDAILAQFRVRGQLA